MDDTLPKYSEWLSEYTFDNCAVGRKAYGEFLASFLAEEKDGFVLNLNGKWGTGKTEFLKRLYTHFHNANHPVIYIDAWESDFTDNPLLVVASELINQLSGQLTVDGSDLDKLKEFLGKFLKGSAILAGSMAGKYFLDDAGGGREFVKALYESSPKALLDTLKKGYSEQVTAVKEVRTQLEHFAKALEKVHSRKLPVMVLVDELDRCRPNYAIEMLEVIKHFFNTKHFVFVVATDTEQLQNSINAVYGEKFDSSVYLRRFFNRKAELKAPNLDALLDKHNLGVSANVSLYPNAPISAQRGNMSYYVRLIVQAYNLDLRTLDQLIAKLESCLRVIAKREGVHSVNIFALLIAIVEFEETPITFKNRGDNNPIEKWHGDDFVINAEDEVRFSELYSFNMLHNVMHERRVENPYGDKVKKLFYYTGLRQNGDISSPTLRNMHTSIKRHLNDNDFTVWIWEDYRDLVKLSHSLS